MKKLFSVVKNWSEAQIRHEGVTECVLPRKEREWKENRGLFEPLGALPGTYTFYIPSFLASFLFSKLANFETLKKEEI